MPINCCAGCTDRREGCHGVCERYITQLAQHRAEKKRAQAQMDANSYFNDLQADVADYKRTGSKLSHLKRRR